MSLKELDILTIGPDSLVGEIMERERECIYSILYDSWSEGDVGRRISDRTTEFFAMDDDTREGHIEIKSNN
jgi:hypothetical protein